MECTRKRWTSKSEACWKRQHHLSSHRYLFSYFHQIYLTYFISTVLLLSSVSDAHFIFANRSNICWINESQLQMRLFNSSLIVKDLVDVRALDFDFEDKIIFWADMGLEAIKGIRLTNGHSFDLVTTGLISPDGIGCDWINKKLYWVDSESRRIEVCNYDGSNRKVLINDELDQPRAIVLVPSEGLMFWSDLGERKIERASMDGNRTSRKVIFSCKQEDRNGGNEVTYNRLCLPTSLAVDYNEKRLFWADTESQQIYSSDFDGNNQQVILQHANISALFGLTLHGSLLSWTTMNVEGTRISLPGIFFYKLKSTGIDPVGYVTMHSYDHPFGLITFDWSRQPTSENSCKQPTASCSHLCLLSSEPPYYSCTCPYGLLLMEDGKTCRSHIENILLVARRTVIEWLSLDTNEFLTIPLPIKEIKNAITLDYDPVEGKLYWADDEMRTIHRAFLNGSQFETIISTEINFPDGLAIDWISRNFYWTDSASNWIQVAHLDGSWRKILISHDLDKPRAIAVHPVQGLLFWSDWGDYGRIERALMDGTERRIVINKNIVWPNGLAIDYELSKIYWCDAKLDRVEMANFDGSARTIILSSGLSHMYGFSLLGEWLYWTDWQDRTVERVHKLTGGNAHIVGENLPDLMGLKASSITPPPGTNACAVNNGNCSHLCLPRSQYQYSCACANGYDLGSDLKSCIFPKSYLLFMRQKERYSDIRRISLQTKEVEPVLLSGLHSPNNFDVDIEDNRIYWADSRQRIISRSFMNGTNVEHIVHVGIKSPEDVAVDWIAKNLYWTDSEMRRIEVARVDGSFRRILISDANRYPHSLAVSPVECLLFWSDWAQGKIERVLLDGVKRKTIVDSNFQAYSLTIDHADKRLYWVSTHISNSNGPRIMSVFFNGTLPRTHVEEIKSKSISLAIFNNYLYYINQSNNAIEKISKNDNLWLKPEIFMTDEMYSTTSDLSVYNVFDQMGWNFCKITRECEHLCFARVSGKVDQPHYQCACAAHYMSLEGHCYPPNSFLLFSQKGVVTRFLFDHKQKSDFQEMTYEMPTKHIKKLAYDPVENQTYWIDLRAIRRMNVNGTEYDTVHHSIQPVDLVIDPYARLLFWTCNMTNTINVTRIIGKPTSIGAVHSSNYDQPRLLAYHFRFNYLYWTNQLSGSARIERISFPNLIKDTVVRDNLEEVTAITVDHEMNYLIWFNTGLKRIEYSDLHGGSRMSMLHEPRLHPIAMTTHSKYLFCVVVEREKKSVVKLPLDLNDGNNMQTIFTRNSPITDIISVTPLITSATYMGCYNENGGCSHLCFITSQSDHKRCGCPKGLILSSADDQSCIEPTECKAEEFRCFTGRCIRSTLRCNGKNECPDGSDELNCPKCIPGQFTCMKNELVCLNEKHRCNGFHDCFDGKDEFCCEKDKFLCKSSGNCLPVFQVCDGKRDCLEGEDEDNCQRARSPNVPSSPLPTSGSLFSYNIYIPLIFLILILVLVSYYQCRRFTDTEEKDFAATDILMTEHRFTPGSGISRNNRNPERNGKKSVMLMSVLGKNHGKQEPACNTLTTTTTISGLDTLSNDVLLNGIPGSSALIPCHSVAPGGESLIERNITGASSTSSSAHVTYPRETANPPPSPVTSSYSSALFVPRSRQKNSALPIRKGKKTKKSSGYKKSKALKLSNRGPPPTPCSTDVYEDIEPSSIKYSMYYDNNHTDLDDFDYKPPPPTPHHYFSEPSSPPSPETERSYRAHYPPPPSPVPEYERH